MMRKGLIVCPIQWLKTGPYRVMNDAGTRPTTRSSVSLNTSLSLILPLIFSIILNFSHSHLTHMHTHTHTHRYTRKMLGILYKLMNYLMMTDDRECEKGKYPSIAHQRMNYAAAK